MEYRSLTKCRICSSEKLHKYFDLGHVPLANSLLDSPLAITEVYPIEVLLCQDCFLSQLSIVINPEKMFRKYLYHSSISKTFQTHCREMAKSLKLMGFKGDVPSLIDIAANDGCLMEQFREEGFVVRGYDPCELMAKEAWENKKLLIIPKFFGKENVDAERCWPGEDFITATNVLAHIDDLHGFLEGVKYHFENNPKGIFVAEFPYFVNLIENNQFDTIYHEHLSYFLLGPLIKLFNDCGIPIFKVERYPIHGGSIRIYASIHKYPTDSSIPELLHLEESNGFYDSFTYHTFALRIHGVMNDFRSTLLKLYQDGQKVMAYGASAKGISLINYSGIPSEHIQSIVDDTPEKQGKWTPGARIPILHSSEFDKQLPDYIILLAWNFAQELILKTRFHHERGGRYIIPIPEVKII